MQKKTDTKTDSWTEQSAQQKWNEKNKGEAILMEDRMRKLRETNLEDSWYDLASEMGGRAESWWS